MHPCLPWLRTVLTRATPNALDVALQRPQWHRAGTRGSAGHHKEDSEEPTMATTDVGARKPRKGGKNKDDFSRTLRIRVDGRTIWQVIGAVLLTAGTGGVDVG